MKKTVDTGGTHGNGYGLGLINYPLSCGGTAWGHGGTIPGYQTYDAVGPDGAAVTIAVTALPQTFVADLHDTAALQEKNQLGLKAVDSLLCNR